MKTIPLLLAVSLALNLAFVAVFFVGRSAGPEIASAPAVSRPKATALPRIDATIWPALESSELPTLIERLRASGFPPALVRAIAAAQITELFAAQRKALRGDLGHRPFWKDNSMADPKFYAAERELDRQQRKMMRELFGNEADADEAMRNADQGRTFTFLPPEKAAEVRRILRDFDERRADLFAANPLYDREKMAALEKEQRGAIAGMLTPAELFEYDLRTSNTANRLRDELSAFQPTEDEFRTIFKLRQPFDEQFDNNPSIMFSADDGRQRFEAEKTLKEQIKAALAPVRAAEYDRATDFNYRRATQLLARLELPRQNADLLWSVQKETEQRRNELYQASRGATMEQRNEQLVALQKEASMKVAPLVGGPQNVDVYKQYGGNWLDYLVPRTPRMPAPRPAITAPQPVPPPTPSTKS